MGKIKDFINEWSWYWKSRYEFGKQQAEELKTKQKEKLKVVSKDVKRPK